MDKNHPERKKEKTISENVENYTDVELFQKFKKEKSSLKQYWN